jgi:hypothetical protein
LIRAKNHVGLAHTIDVGQGYAPAGPTIARFHRSDSFFRGIKGPVGSSKSSACVMEIFSRAMEQKACNGRRRTRWAVLRRTYPELKSTTIKTWCQWVPERAAPIRWDAPINCNFVQELPDRTVMEMEVLFFPLERPEDIDVLSSLELTGGWINEAREMELPILEKLTERVNRFPPVAEGGPTWTGVIADTNPPDTDSWWFKLAAGTDSEMRERMEQIEEQLRAHGGLRKKQKLYEFFDQPGGLILQPDGSFADNPAAENIANLPGKYGYYYKIAANKKKEYIRTQILGEYGTTIDGKAVFEHDYNDDLHCERARAEPLKSLPLIVGLDYGRSPAAVLCQVTPRGQLRVVDEVYGYDMGIGVFAEDVLKPHLAQHYRDYDIIPVGDPAGVAKESDERSAFDILAENGIVAVPAHTNSITGRLEAVKHFLSRMPDGQPAFALNRKCETLRKGFLGKYHFKRVATSFDRYKDVPEKDDYSHGQDALQYAALYARLEAVNDVKFKQKINYPQAGLV